MNNHFWLKAFWWKHPPMQYTGNDSPLLPAINNWMAKAKSFLCQKKIWKSWESNSCPCLILDCTWKQKYNYHQGFLSLEAIWNCLTRHGHRDTVFFITAGQGTDGVWNYWWAFPSPMGLSEFLEHAQLVYFWISANGFPFAWGNLTPNFLKFIYSKPMLCMFF